MVSQKYDLCKFLIGGYTFMCISFMSVFLCFYVLFAVCVNGPLWTDFQINGKKLTDWLKTKE